MDWHRYSATPRQWTHPNADQLLNLLSPRTANLLATGSLPLSPRLSSRITEGPLHSTDPSDYTKELANDRKATGDHDSSLNGEVIDRNFHLGRNFHKQISDCNFLGRIRVARVACVLHKSMFTIIQK